MRLEIETSDGLYGAIEVDAQCSIMIGDEAELGTGSQIWVDQLIGAKVLKINTSLTGRVELNLHPTEMLGYLITHESLLTKKCSIGVMRENKE